MEVEKWPIPNNPGKYIMLKETLKDNEFLRLPSEEQKKGLVVLSKEFAQLNHNEQEQFLYALKTKNFSVYKGDFIFFIYLTLLPPLLLLGIGTAIYWAFRGFSSK